MFHLVAIEYYPCHTDRVGFTDEVGFTDRVGFVDTFVIPASSVCDRDLDTLTKASAVPVSPSLVGYFPEHHRLMWLLYGRMWTRKFHLDEDHLWYLRDAYSPKDETDLETMYPWLNTNNNLSSVGSNDDPSCGKWQEFYRRFPSFPPIGNENTKVWTISVQGFGTESVKGQVTMVDNNNNNLQCPQAPTKKKTNHTVGSRDNRLTPRRLDFDSAIVYSDGCPPADRDTR